MIRRGNTTRQNVNGMEEIVANKHAKVAMCMVARRILVVKILRMQTKKIVLPVAVTVVVTVATAVAAVAAVAAAVQRPPQLPLAVAVAAVEIHRISVRMHKHG